MGEAAAKKQKATGERRSGLVVAAIFVVAALYVAVSYARFHMKEYGEERHEAGRADLCNEIKAKRPVFHERLMADKLCQPPGPIN